MDPNSPGLPIFGYGVMILTAFLLCTWLASKRAQKYQIAKDRVQDITTMTLLAGLLGARIMHLILYSEGYSSFVDFFKFYEGGLVLYGCVLTAPLMVWYKLKKYGISWDIFFKVFIPVIPLGVAIGRMGCFLHGCCYGVPGEMPWCVQFPDHAPASIEFPGLHVHPSQLYAALLGCSLSLFLFWISDKKKNLSGKHLGIIFMFSYGFIRLLEESFRGDTPDHVGNYLNAGQGISLLLIILAPILYFTTRPKTAT